MKTTEPILNYKNEPFKENEVAITPQLVSALIPLSKENIISYLKAESTKNELTYRDVIHTALNSREVKEDGKAEVLDSATKSKLYEITTKLFASAEFAPTPTEVTLILERINKIFPSPIICGRVKDFLDKK